MKKLLCRVLSLVLILGTLNFISPPVSAAEATAKGRGSPDDERYIWDFFEELTGNPYGTAGIIGNLYFESHLLSENLEPLGHEMPSLGGITYIDAIDNGVYTGFANDGMGFGLAQWTFPTRKARLVELADCQGRSIGSLDVQLDLIAEELERFNMLYRLSTAESVRFASDYVLKNFENPGDQSEEMLRSRAKICQSFYEKYAGSGADLDITNAQGMVLGVARESDTYGIVAQEGYCQAWVAEVYEEAGFPLDPSNSASESAEKFSVSDDLDNIPAGAAIYGHSETEHGHVGIYMGNGYILHNAGGSVKQDTLDDWIQNYDGYSWGWIGGTNLSQYP